MQGLNPILASLEAEQQKVFDVIMLNAQQQICETAAANIFFFKDNVLYTPALATPCLNGSTRNAILKLSPYAVKEIFFNIANLQTAEEVFITNCNYCVMPV